MKKYIILSATLLFAVNTFAQKDEIKAIKKILDKTNAKEDDYKQAKILIDQTTPYIGNATPAEQAEFYFYKGSFELRQAEVGGNPELFASAVQSLNKLKAVEANEKKKPFTDKIDKELLPGISKLSQKAMDYSKNKKYREATSIFKSLYDLNKDPLMLYYAASTSLSVPDYNTALEYYQELLDMNFTGEFEYYTALNKKENIRETFSTKALMDEAVKLGAYTDPKKEMETSKKPEILKNMVLIYLNVNQKARAQKLLDDARKENPDDLQLLLVEANFHLQNEDMAKFEAVMNQAIQKDPTNPELYYNLGVTSSEAGNVDIAKQYYQKALQLNPEHVNANINYGALIVQGDQAVIDKMNALGYSKEDQKKYEQYKVEREQLLKSAIPYFEKALSVEPDNQYAIANLVGIYGALEITDKEAEYKAKLKN
jgi:tetratricopeptide (TPR) repeat protein